MNNAINEIRITLEGTMSRITETTSSSFSWPFFLSSSSGTPMIRMLGHLTLCQRSLRLSSFLLILFSFFLSASFISTILSSTSLILSLLPQLFYCWFPPECFWSQLLHYSLLIDSISCIFSIFVSRLFICNSILFSRFWIIFTIIMLNSFSGKLPISSSFI